MSGNGVPRKARVKKGNPKEISETSSSSPKTSAASSSAPKLKRPSLEIRLAAMICLIAGCGGIASSAAVVLMYISGKIGAVPLLNRIVEQFAGKATIFGIGIIGMSLVLVIAGYMLLRRSVVGGALAMSASTILMVLPALSLWVSVAIEPFVAGMVAGVVLICLVASGWEVLS